MIKFLTVLNIIFYSILFEYSGFSQDNPYEIKEYPFVRYELNELCIYDSTQYKLLFEKLTQIGLKGEGKVSIVHIGDSHLQADFYSGNFRKKLQTFFLGAMGGRGFIFPYTVAQTNNPANYKVTSEGRWENCRNVEKMKKCKLGLSGISVSTTDINASITISIDDPSLAGYDFDRLMVFHEYSKSSYEPVIENAKIIAVTSFPDKGYTLFEFEENISSVQLKLKKTDSSQTGFDLYGLNFDSSDTGIIYHSIGVNGAKFDSYLGCEYFSPHLSVLNPDWVIISLGTNDVYTHVFDTIAFKSRVDSLIGFVKKAAPNAGVLLITPGDHRIQKGRINNNIEVAGLILMRLAAINKISYWDFNSIMGGYGSIDKWYMAGMAHIDYLHYTPKGYEYQAQLLFTAFLRAYDDFLVNEFLVK